MAFRELSKEEQSKKKPEIFEKVLQGKLNKRLSEMCLMDQAHVAEAESPVMRKHLQTIGANIGKNVTFVLPAFWRWHLGQI